MQSLCGVFAGSFLDGRGMIFWNKISLCRVSAGSFWGRCGVFRGRLLYLGKSPRVRCGAISRNGNGNAGGRLESRMSLQVPGGVIFPGRGVSTDTAVSLVGSFCYVIAGDWGLRALVFGLRWKVAGIALQSRCGIILYWMDSSGVFCGMFCSSAFGLWKTPTSLGGVFSGTFGPGRGVFSGGVL